MASLLVGSQAVHVEQLSCGSRPREILRVTIVRETKTQWIDDNGTHWRKSDRAQAPQYRPGPRFLMSVEEFEATTTGEAVSK